MKLTLNDLHELANPYDVNEIIEGFQHVANGIDTNEHRWYCTSNVVIKHVETDKYYMGYYYHTLRSESMGICDIQDLNTEIELTEVQPVEKIVIDWEIV